MRISETLVTAILRGAYTIILSTALFGGYIVVGFLFLKPELQYFNYLGTMIIATFFINLAYFLFCLLLGVAHPTYRRLFFRVALGMLLNIPLAIVYLVILISFQP